MTRPAVWLAVALVLGGCHRSHDESSERDTKGRSNATMGTDPITPVATTTRDAGIARDPALVELGMVTLVWKGTIRESSGKAPPVGTSCTLTTRVRSTTANNNQAVDQLNVLCGAQMLYDVTGTYSGQQAWDYRVTERPVPGTASVFDYRIRASDVGTRTGDRNQMTVSSQDKELIVHRDIAPTFRVKIEVEVTSAPRSGKPLFENQIPAFNTVIKSKATLTSSKGVLPFTGKTCELRISPGDKTHNCIVKLECNAKIIFGVGTSGWEDCTLSGDAPVSLNDTQPTPKDHDPELSVDMDAKTAVLADELPNGSYTATFKLE